jgi:hypothetical protein
MTEEAAAVPVAKKPGSEWFWRFLAVVMVFVIGWVVWIAYQLSPPPLVTTAAFEAAANARATRNTEGRIVPASSDATSDAAPVPEAAASEPAPPKEPPVNVDKLKLSDTLSSVAPQGSRPSSGAAK